MLGVTAGTFVAPFLAVGMTARYSRIETKDRFVDRVSGDEIGLTDGHGRVWTVAPFVMLTAPAGPVQLTLTGIFVPSRGHIEYDQGTLVPPPDDKPAVASRVIEAAARTEERRVGKECVSTGRSRRSPCTQQQQKKKIK